MMALNMLSKIRLILLTLSLLTFSFSTLAYAACGPNVSTKEAIQCGAGQASGDKTSPDKAEDNATTTIRNLLNFFSAVIGVIAVVMLIIGGFRYITSSGNEQNTKSARDTIVYALIGLVIVAFAQIIVKLVLQNTG